MEPPFFIEFGIQLAMAAAVASTAVVSTTTAAVEPASAAMEAVAAAEALSTMEAAVTAAETFMSVVTAASIITVAVIAAATVEAAAVVAAVKPRAGADKDASGEIVRAVVAVWSASVRIVAVVTVSADWGGTDRAVHGAYPDAHAKLRLGGTSGKKQNSE